MIHLFALSEDLLQRNPIKPQLSLAQRFPKATAEAIDLLEKLLKFDPSERIDINDAISHPFVTSFSQSYTEELQKGKQADFTFETIANDVASIRAFITEEIIKCKDLNQFEDLIVEHENIIANATSQEPIHQSVFSAYSQGKIKSLGAWGGDFILVTSKNNDLSFFKNKGYNTILKLSDLVYIN